MHLPSWLHFSLGLSCFQGGCNPSSASNDQPTQTDRPEPVQPYMAPRTTGFGGQQTAVPKLGGPASPFFLEKNGYTYSDLHGGIIGVYTERYGQNNEDAVLELYIDTETQVTTVFSNKLHLESHGIRNLQTYQIIQALHYEQGMDIKKMKWSAMSIDHSPTMETIREYRESNRLSPGDDIKLVPTSEGWAEFVRTLYYEMTYKMVPGAEIDRIIVKSQTSLDTDVSDGEAPASEMIMFSFTVPLNDNEAAIDQKAAELAAEDNLNAGLQAAKNAMDAYVKNIQETASA
ncbi:hypothetical protein CFIMG_007600RA00001 [Ceratocystis fimbriata CBS 114723]|uniref:Uncharacterized protein n=1 Tax=Ceratocystis fimbriata CBS 114723 TaxID=1035309 RepID=A0A2C5W6J8_9PEZI|nr:hypothetical protein CFIMG_007600RA00001 [Ceratocystis fimbriata CBS 114723]